MGHELYDQNYLALVISGYISNTSVKVTRVSEGLLKSKLNIFIRSVIDQKKELIGSGSLWLQPESPRTGVIKDFIISDEFASIGHVSGSLLSALLNDALFYGIQNLMAEFNIHTESEKIELFKKHGFEMTYDGGHNTVILNRTFRNHLPFMVTDRRARQAADERRLGLTSLCEQSEVLNSVVTPITPNARREQIRHETSENGNGQAEQITLSGIAGVWAPILLD